MIQVHVLLCDDEADIREIIELSLGLDPLFVFRACASGYEALATAADWRPDLILLDVTMPEMDGPTTLGKLRENRSLARIPIVFTTARTQARECQHFISLGAAGVIAKPFDPMALASLVRAYIPMENKLAPVRTSFLRRMSAIAAELAACRAGLAETTTAPAMLTRVKEIAHSLKGTSGVYGLAGISCESAALEETAAALIAGKGAGRDIGQPLDRLLARIEAH